MSGTTFGGSITVQANGAKLKELRGGRKQRDVEEACAIPYGQLTRSETGKQAPINHILRLSSFYGVAPRELLSDEGRMSVGEFLNDLARLVGATIIYPANGEREVTTLSVPPVIANSQETIEQTANDN